MAARHEVAFIDPSISDSRRTSRLTTLKSFPCPLRSLAEPAPFIRIQIQSFEEEKNGYSITRAQAALSHRSRIPAGSRRSIYHRSNYLDRNGICCV